MSDTERFERHPRKRYPVVSENIEPDIERDLTIPLLELPAPFDGYLREEHLREFNDQPGVLKILLGVSKLEQAQDWVICSALNLNRFMRRLQAEQIRLRKQLHQEQLVREERERIAEEKNKIDLRDVTKKWVLRAIALGGAFAIGALTKWKP